jgi:hypothetical protein
MSAEPTRVRTARVRPLQLAGWIALGALLLISAAVSYAGAVFIGR